jgi:hypothetical protein
VKVLDVSHWIDTITCQPIIDSCDHYTANLQVITSVYGYGNSPWTCYTGSEETPIPCKKVSWQRYPLSHTHGGASDEEYYNQGPGLLVEGQEYIIAIKSWGVSMKPDGTFINEEYPWLVVPVVNDVVLDEYNYFGLGDHANKYELIETLHNGINHY